MALPYEHPLWSTALGESLHPGGESLSRRLVELCSFRKGDHVLDAGCGPGVTLGILIEMGVDAVGLDTSCHFLEMAAERGPVVKGELLSLPFGDGSLDGAVAEVIKESRVRTYDMGGKSTSLEMGRAVADKL